MDGKLAISVITQKNSKMFEFRETNETALKFYSDIIKVFSKVDANAKRINVTCLQRMSEKIKKEVRNITLSFKGINIDAMGVYNIFKKISNDEWFYILPISNDFTSKQRMYCEASLSLLNMGIKFESKEYCEKLKSELNILEKTDDLISYFNDKYTLTCYGDGEKEIYGEKIKEKRICKYCKRKMPDVTFKEKAHAIPEGLGNKVIISTEECDECNHRFSETIENDIIKFLQIFRVLYGKGGKNGKLELKFKNNIKMKYVDNIATVNSNNLNNTVIIIDSSGKNKVQNGNAYIPLEFCEKINFMNIYRCLVKFAIAVLPFETINHLSKTIDWINNVKNDASKLDLPVVASFLDNRCFYDQPTLLIYERKDDDFLLPHLYCEFRTCFFAFVYIIPFSDKDKLDFSIKGNFEKFWEFNKHYSQFKSWIFNNFNKDESHDFTFNLNINKQVNKQTSDTF